MLLERLTITPDEEATIVQNRASRSIALNLQDPNTAMTELITVIANRQFKTIDADPNRWSMQGGLVQSDSNTYKMQVFLNITGANDVYLQVEIIGLGDQPQILVEGSFNVTKAIEMVNKLPYFPHYE